MLAPPALRDTHARLAARSKAGLTTVWRHVTGLVDLLAAHALDSTAAMDVARRKAAREAGRHADQHRPSGAYAPIPAGQTIPVSAQATRAERPRRLPRVS